jgi:hemolysin activation/secretion protein
MTDIVFQVDDRLPVRAYAGYEDTGTRQTELERIIFGVNWGNALFRDHQLGYQYTTSADFEKLRSHTAVYEIPLLNRDTLLFFGSYAEVQADVPAQFDQNGIAWQASCRYNWMLYPVYAYEHHLVAGFDFKQTNTDLDFGGTTVFDSSVDIAQMVFGYHGEAPAVIGPGLLSVGADVYISPGEFSSGNNDFDFGQIRPFAEAEYVYSRMYAEREVPLPWYLRFVGRLTGQISEANLMPSEQLGYGGYYSIRGYDMRRVNGDSGYVLNLELQTEPISLGLGRRGSDELRLLTFYDQGTAYNHTLLPGEDPSVDLASFGLGFRYALPSRGSVRFDYGWPVVRIAPGDRLKGRAHVGAVLAY